MSMKNWTFSKKWRYAIYERCTQKRSVRFYIGFGRWRACDDPNCLKDKVHILPFVDFYFNTSEFYIGLGWLIFEMNFYTHNFEKYDKLIRRAAESR